MLEGLKDMPVPALYGCMNKEEGAVIDNVCSFGTCFPLDSTVGGAWDRCRAWESDGTGRQALAGAMVGACVHTDMRDCTV